MFSPGSDLASNDLLEEKGVGSLFRTFPPRKGSRPLFLPNVTAVVDIAGTVVERYVYAPYGAVSVLDGGWAARPEKLVSVHFVA